MTSRLLGGRAGAAGAAYVTPLGRVGLVRINGRLPDSPRLPDLLAGQQFFLRDDPPCSHMRDAKRLSDLGQCQQHVVLHGHMVRPSAMSIPDMRIAKSTFLVVESERRIS